MGIERNNPNLVPNSILIPRGCPETSGIKVLELNDQGVKVVRLHPNYNNETFFLNWDALKRSQWILP